MTREELNKQLELPNEFRNTEKFSSDLQLRNHIELRLIADALTDISKSLKVDILNTHVHKHPITYRIADILYNFNNNQ